MNSQRAILSNESNYTVFRVGDKVIRFRAPYSLEHYTEVKETIFYKGIMPSEVDFRFSSG